MLFWPCISVIHLGRNPVMGCLEEWAESPPSSAGQRARPVPKQSNSCATLLGAENWYWGEKERGFFKNFWLNPQKLLAKSSETNKSRFEQTGVKYFVPFALLLDNNHFSDVIHTSTHDRNKKYFVEVQVLWTRISGWKCLTEMNYYQISRALCVYKVWACLLRCSFSGFKIV